MISVVSPLRGLYRSRILNASATKRAISLQTGWRPAPRSGAPWHCWVPCVETSMLSPFPGAACFVNTKGLRLTSNTRLIRRWGTVWDRPSLSFTCSSSSGTGSWTKSVRANVTSSPHRTLGNTSRDSNAKTTSIGCLRCPTFLPCSLSVQHPSDQSIPPAKPPPRQLQLQPRQPPGGLARRLRQQPQIGQT
jgi:hypothetical protein